MEQNNSKSYGSALYTIITVFFFWGFLAASNGIFIPFCKSNFHLTQFESQLIDFTFYGGYFIGSLILYYASQLFKTDILNKMGYKNGIIIGLIISAVGALLMIPAVGTGSYGLVLSAIFVITIGFSLQQTAANPFVVALGPPETGSNRLNFAGSINNIGGLLGPAVISIVLFGSANSHIAPENVKISSIDNLYYIFAGLLLAVALFFRLSKLPVVSSNEKVESTSKPGKPIFVLFIAFLIILAVDPLVNLTGISKPVFVYTALAVIIVTLIISLYSAEKNKAGWGAMQYPQLILGMIAIFTYVGTEVTIQSNMGALLKLPLFGGFKDSEIAPYISLYWGSLMIGRFTGAIGAFNLSKNIKNILTVIVPFIAFGIVLLVNRSTVKDVSTLFVYSVSIVILIVAFFIGQQKPVRTLVTLGILGVLFMLVGLLSTGMLAVFSFISGGLCCSIMWPSIFSLSITGLGKYTGQGSAFLIMMILGGSIIPPVQGLLADTVGIHPSYLVPFLGFAYIVFFAWKVRAELLSQGINIDHMTVEKSGGH